MDIFLAGFILGVGTVLMILVLVLSYRATRRGERYLNFVKTARIRREGDRASQWWKDGSAGAVVPTQPTEEPWSLGRPVPAHLQPQERPVLGTMDHRRVKPARRR